MALKLYWRAAGGCCLRHGNSALPIPVPVSLGNRTTAYSSARSSSSNLFVGGLSYDTNETALKDAFSQCGGDVVAVKVICHPTTGKSKGFGFVNFSSQNQAAQALHKMNGQLLDGRNIRVHYANSTSTEDGSAATDDS